MLLTRGFSLQGRLPSLWCLPLQFGFPGLPLLILGRVIFVCLLQKVPSYHYTPSSPFGTLPSECDSFCAPKSELSSPIRVRSLGYFSISRVRVLFRVQLGFCSHIALTRTNTSISEENFFLFLRRFPIIFGISLLYSSRFGGFLVIIWVPFDSPLQ